jgi:cbb3-type cytochrome oxidase subunit 3
MHWTTRLLRRRISMLGDSPRLVSSLNRRWRTQCAPPPNEASRKAMTMMLAMEFTVYHLLIIVAFVCIVGWAFGRKRKSGFEKDAKIPFDGDKG